MQARRATGKDLRPAGATCEECGLQDCILVESYGPEQADFVLVGEAPGNQELRLGRPFVGPAGNLLDRALKEVGLDREEIFFTNSVLCRPDPHRAPKMSELECCWGRLKRELEQRQPKVIVAMGRSALKTLLGLDKLGDNRGLAFELEELGAWVIPTWHTAYVLRGRREVYSDIVRDLAHAKELVANPVRVEQGPVEYIVNELPELTSEEAVIDIELTSTGELICIGVADLQGGPVYVVADEDKLVKLPALLRGKKLIAHNAKFEWEILTAYLGLDMDPAFDTMLANYLVDGRIGVNSLEDVVKNYLPQDPDLGRWSEFKPLRKKGLENLNPEDVYWYNAKDVNYSRQLVYAQGAEMDEDDWRVLHNLLLPAIKPLGRMEQRGVYIDQQRLAELDKQFSARADELEAQMVELVGQEFNPRSPQQVGRILFDELGLPDLQDGSTKAEVLETLKEYHDLIQLLLDYRRVHKLLSTYVRRFRKQLVDGRLHGRFNIGGTATGRLSSAGPNLQNIPKHKGEESMLVRGLFAATPGYTWVSADVSQAELRCLAYYCRDKNLLAAIEAGTDLHAQTARMVFGVPPGEPVGSKLRSVAKTLNFAMLYGAGPDKMMEIVLRDLERRISYQEARDLIDRWYKAFPLAQEWIDGIRQELLDTGQVVTPLGRKRSWVIVDQSALREGVNFPIQSLASDIVLSGLIDLDPQLADEDYLLLTVHDEIDGETSRDAVDYGRLMRQTILDAAHRLTEYVIPFEVEVKIGPRWSELKEVKVA